MPSARKLPTVRDLIKAGQQAVTGQVDDYADVRTGSLYDHIIGPSATLQARHAIADRDKFRAIYISSAKGPQLTDLVEGRLGTKRIPGAAGTGNVLLQRATAGAGVGEFWQGTRFQVPGNPPSLYQVAADTPCSATALVALVPIEAVVPGPGSLIADAGASILDPVWDSSWDVVTLSCGAGTDFEDATTYVARARTELLQNRNGYLAKILAACAGVGAVNTIAFASSTGLPHGDLDDDFGISAIYVGDANFGSTPSMVSAAAGALESCRVLGNDLWIGGLQNTVLPIVATVNLVDNPGNLPQIVIARACLQAVLRYFPAYVLKAKALSAAIAGASPYIQQVQLTSPDPGGSSDTSVPTLVFSDDDGVFPNSEFRSVTWPATLTIFTAQPNRVSLSIAGPV